MVGHDFRHPSDSSSELIHDISSMRRDIANLQKSLRNLTLSPKPISPKPESRSCGNYEVRKLNPSEAPLT